MVDETYDNWDDTLEEDRQSGRSSNSIKKWSLRWKPTEAPTRIHLSRPEKPYIHPVSGKEFPFRAGKQHYIPGRGKNGVFIECGADRGENCAVCAYSNPTAWGLTNVAADSQLALCKARVYYAMSGWVEEDYHLVDVNNKNSDGTHKEHWRCLGRGCEYCRDGFPKVFGNMFYMEVSPGQWRHSFHDLHKKVENSYCQCGGTIYVPSFNCAGCQAIVLDVFTTCPCGGEVGLDSESGQAICGKCQNTWSAFYAEHTKIYENSNEQHQCKACGHHGYLVPSRMCSNEECSVRPHSIFDCQLTIKSIGVKKEKRTIFDSYKVQEPDPRLFDPAYQGDDEWAQKMADYYKRPLNLDELLKAPSVEEQCTLLGKPNPFLAIARGGNRFARYTGNKDQTEEVAE
jgi:hypothetical protein